MTGTRVIWAVERIHRASDGHISRSLVQANHAAATVPGAVQGKLEVFDINGNSLGFVALFNSIT